jgi:outer membrane cobalamin receptor
VQTGLLALATSLPSGLAGGFAPAWAQDQQPPASSAISEVYTAQDFARFAPRNALDLIERIPGFDLGGSGGGGGGGGGGGDAARGFGQADENLLINGERISSKSTSTADQLSRIPIANVVRIEVVDGATLGIPGLSGRVANIIVIQGGPSGQFEWRPQFPPGSPLPAGSKARFR